MANRSLKNILSRNLSLIPGWRTKRRIVVLESDDWGSIRMPSNETFENLSGSGIDLESDEGYRYNRYDTLATADDLSLLFGVLSSVKDKTGRPAVMTPVAVVANPDFRRIRESGFTEYFYEPFTETLKRFKGCEESFSLWKEGIDKRLFMPQFHGREHLNVKVWMRALGSGHTKTMTAFNYGMWGITTGNDPVIRAEFQAAFDFIDPDDLKYHKEVISTGLRLFGELLGYRASYFVPPNGPFNRVLESVCVSEGIKYLQVSKLHTEPLGEGKTRKSIHWPGQKAPSGLIYMNRNCFFEPGENGKDWVDSCLFEISTAFRWHKPAVISSHRVNYIGSLDKSNRDIGLKQLAMLLNGISKKWPDVEFLTSSELGEAITNE